MLAIRCRIRQQLPLVLVVVVALWLRGAGLFHGLSGGQTFHPDETKQIQAVQNFMHGNILWYTGSLAYDGYPYGLNHVDAAILRGMWPLIRTVAEGLQPGAVLPRVPDRDTLFRLCRGLRVVYGMLALLLFGFALRQRGVSPGDRTFALLVAATAPLLTTVTHSASGDVGTDLFVMAALAALSPARLRPSAWAFLASGFFIGCAFSSKYHGILAAATPGLLLLLQPWPWATRIRLGAICAAGALGGFALLTPALFIRFRRTLQLIRDNFRYIRRYGTDPAFFEQPLLRRSWISLTSNLPVVVHAIGALLLLLALVLLAWALARRFRRGEAEDGGHAWDIAVLAMPFLVLALALAGKPSLQPFHFSFLPLPLLLGVWGVISSQARGTRFLSRLLLGVTLVVQIGVQRDELRYWLREDARQTASRISEEALLPVSEPRNLGAVGVVALEGNNLAVFRNRPRPILFPDAGMWNTQPREALPAIPYDFGRDWVLLDLPSLPREPRLVHLRDRECWQRDLIETPSRNHPLPLLLQAGERAVHVTAELNGERKQVQLAPHQTTRLHLNRRRGESYQREDHARLRHHVRLLVTGGDLLMRLGEEDPPGDPARVAAKLEACRFLEGTFRFPQGRSRGVLVDRQHLPAARYQLSLDWPSALPAPALIIENAQLPHPDLSQRIEFTPAGLPGQLVAEWEHPGDPLFCQLLISGTHHTSQPLTWTLRPLAATTPRSPARHPPPPFDAWVSFAGGALRLGNIAFPSTTTAREGLPLTLRASISPTWERRVTEHAVFIHLVDGAGRQALARDLPLASILPDDSPRRLTHHIALDGLAPGEYRVVLGLYHPRTGVRLRPQTLNGRALAKARVDLGPLHVRAEPAD